METSMDIERDEATGASYYRLSGAPVVRTVHVTELVMVDLDDQGRPVGVEVATNPERLDPRDVKELIRAFPELVGQLPLTRPQRPRDLNQLAAHIVQDATTTSPERAGLQVSAADLRSVAVDAPIWGSQVAYVHLTQQDLGSVTVA